MSRTLCVLSLAATVATMTGSAQAPERSMLWTVRAAAGGPPTYLAGSVHVLSKQYYPLKDRWNRAFESSTVLIEEVDLAETDSPEAALGLLSKGVMADGRTLRDIIPGELHDSVMARGRRLGLPEVALRRMKPWMVAMSLTAPELRNQGFDPALGVDRHFYERAKQSGKERRALETAAFQFDRLDQLSMPLQTMMLRSAIEDMDTASANIGTIAEAWSTGNVPTLERLMLAALLESPELYERLLVERNRSWISPIEDCLTRKTACFVVVGAAHLVGPHSVVAMLKEKGYTVEQQ